MVLCGSVVNKDPTLKAKAKAEDLALKAKAKDLSLDLLASPGFDARDTKTKKK